MRELKTTDGAAYLRLKTDFSKNGDFGPFLDLVKTRSKYEKHEGSSGRMKLTRKGFFRYFRRMGTHEKKIASMWDSNTDEFGDRLKKTKNAAGRKVLCIDMDETEVHKHGRESRIEAKTNVRVKRKQAQLEMQSSASAEEFHLMLFCC